MDNNKKRKNKPKREKCTGLTSSGRPCGNYAAEGSDKCRARHSGKAVKGTHHYNYQGRGWSKHLPKDMLDKAELIMQNPDWLTLMQEIEYLNLELADLAEKLASREGNPQAKWVELKRAFKKMKAECKNNLALENLAGMKEIEELVDFCSEDHMLRKEMFAAMQKKASLLKHQQEINMREKFYVSLDQMLLFFHALCNGIDAILPKADVQVNSLEVRHALMLEIKRRFNIKPMTKQIPLIQQDYPQNEIVTNSFDDLDF